MRPVERIYTLRGDAPSAAGFAHRTLENITDGQVTPDLLHVDRLALVGKARIPGDDEEPADAGQRGDDLLDHAISKIFLLGITAHVLERHYRQRRLIRQRRHAARRNCHARTRLRGDSRHRRGKAIAAPTNGLDAALLCPPLVNDPAKRGDLHVEIAVFDRHSRPYRGDDLGPWEVVPWPLHQHAENVESARTHYQWSKNAALIPPEKDADPAGETELTE